LDKKSGQSWEAGVNHNPSENPGFKSMMFLAILLRSGPPDGKAAIIVKKIEFKQALIIAGLIVIALRVWLFFEHPQEDDHVDKLFTFIVTLGGCAAAIYAIHDTSKSVGANTSQARTAASLDFLRNFMHDQKYLMFRKLVLESGKNGDELEKEILTSRTQGDGTLADAVACILAQFEILALSIKSKNVDEDILYYAVSFNIVYSIKNLDIYIRNERERRKQQSYLVEIDDIIKCWEEDLSWITRKKYKRSCFSDASNNTRRN
jgi:Domain of unknown function (DUF4760)